MFSECSALEPRREQPQHNWHRAWVAALVPRRGHGDEGEGDPLRGCGLPPFPPPSGPSSDFFPLRFEENPCTNFCRPLGGEWAIKVEPDKNPC